MSDDLVIQAFFDELEKIAMFNMPRPKPTGKPSALFNMPPERSATAGQSVMQRLKAILNLKKQRQEAEAFAKGMG